MFTVKKILRATLRPNYLPATLSTRLVHLKHHDVIAEVVIFCPLRKINITVCNSQRTQTKNKRFITIYYNIVHS